MNVKLFVEGGGESEELQDRCREAFHRLFLKAGLRGRMPRIVASGSRNATFEDFKTACLNAGGKYVPILLVDSKLEAATRACSWEKRYRKGRRSFQVLGELNPATLEQLLPHFKRLIDTLKNL